MQGLSETQFRMDSQSPSPTHGNNMIEDYGNVSASMAKSKQILAREDPSDDDPPASPHRKVGKYIKEEDERTDLDTSLALQEDDYDDIGHAWHNRPPLIAERRKSPKTVTERPRKPGPRSWASKPIMKNDMVAKKALIREIESYWGKDFIRSYVPKCHRPLAKGSKQDKRSAHRARETDPEKWLPSILKSILMIAKLTDDKEWLKEAMNEVVSYRIRHTGNRKPQLVTTDFDIIEDMLVKDWTIPFAFEIRYKHLLTNRNDQDVEDDNIDHILQTCSDREDTDSEDAKGTDKDGTEEEREVKPSEGNMLDEEDDVIRRLDRTSKKVPRSKCNASISQHSSSRFPQQQRPGKQASLNSDYTTVAQTDQILNPQERYGPYGYSMPMPVYYPPWMGPWSGPIPIHPGHDSYESYNNYEKSALSGHRGGSTPSQHSSKQHGRKSSNQPLLHSMHTLHHSLIAPAPRNTNLESPRHSDSLDFHSDLSSFGRNRHPYMAYGGDVFPGQPRPAMLSSKRALDADKDINTQPSTVRRSTSAVTEVNKSLPSHIKDNHNAAVNAEVQVAELELKVARLRAKQAALKKAT